MDISNMQMNCLKIISVRSVGRQEARSSASRSRLTSSQFDCAGLRSEGSLNPLRLTIKTFLYRASAYLALALLYDRVTIMIIGR